MVEDVAHESTDPAYSLSERGHKREQYGDERVEASQKEPGEA